MELFYELPAESNGYFLFKKAEDIGAKAHFHGAIEFLFVMDGERKVTVGDTTKILSAGDGCFVDGFILHEYQCGGDGVCYALLGNSSYFEPFFSVANGKPPTFFTFNNFDLLENLYLLCKKPYKNLQISQTVFLGAMQLLLAEISNQTPFTAQKQNKETILICEILRYAENNLTENLSLINLAKKFGYSHEHLSRLLHTHLFESWNSYVNRLRVRKAHNLLSGKNLNQTSVLQIAYDCGFNSSNTFYRAYKKEFGVSPCKNINF